MKSFESSGVVFQCNTIVKTGKSYISQTKDLKPKQKCSTWLKI